MLDNFRSMMKPASVTTTVDYFNHTFMPLGPVSVGTIQAAKEEPAMMAAMARQLHTTPAQLQTAISTQFPAMGKMLTSLPALTTGSVAGGAHATSRGSDPLVREAPSAV